MRWKLLGGVCVALVMSPWVQAAQSPVNRFDVLEYRVEGNSLLDDSSIEKALMPYLGERRSFQDVESARAALEKAYHARGYLTVLVKVPEQEVQDGLVTLEVTEATVSRLRVVGSQYHLPSAIREQLPELAEGQVPNFTQVQQSLSQLNQAADIKVSPVLKPGKVPGTVDVQLDVEDQLPLHGSVEVNDRQALNTTRTRMSASARYDNLWQQGHSLGLSVQASPEKASEARVASMNYMMPVGRQGDALTVYAVSSRSQFASIYNSPGLGILGNAFIMGGRYSFALKADDDFIQSLTLGADLKNLQQASGTDGVHTDDPAIHYAPLTLNYKGIWPGVGLVPTTLDVSAILGVRGLLGNSDARFQAKKPGYDGLSANFLALRSSFRKQTEIQKWAINTQLDWQLASGPLLDSEQFIAGGVDTVRGYYEGERKGDQALRLSFEVQSPAWSAPAWLGNAKGQGIAFVDEVVLKTLQAPEGTPSHTTLASAGVGLRVVGPRGLSFSLDKAWALKDGDVNGGGTRKGAWRYHSRLSVEF